MAITASGIPATNLKNALTGALALNYGSSNTNLKLALFTNSVTPNFDTDTGYGTGTWATNEVTGTNWSAGGVALASNALTASGSGNVSFTAANVSQSTVTISGARCAVIYDNVLAGKNILFVYNFGADYGASAGTFAITWGSSIFYLHVTSP